MNLWYSRPVLFVESVERSIAFYTEKLGFTEGFSYQEEGKILVGQVDREDCEIILNCQQPEKTGRSRIFISIDLAPLQVLRVEFENRGAPIRDGWWGYDTMIIEDPDGNELFFPYPKDTEAKKRAEGLTGLPKAGAKPEGRSDGILPLFCCCSALHLFSAFSAQKSHVKPQNRLYLSNQRK